MTDKEHGRAVAKRMSEITGKDVVFVERCCLGFHFQVTQHRTYNSTGIDGGVTESKLTDKWEAPGTLVYSVVTCFPEQCENGDLEWFIKNGMTQDLEISHE